MLWSLNELARCANTDPKMQTVTAFHARIAFASRSRREKVIEIAAKYGFVRLDADRRPPFGQRVHDFFENFWLWSLVVAFNPGSARRRRLIRQRDDLWISRSALIRQFGPDTALSASRIRSNRKAAGRVTNIVSASAIIRKRMR
jgi:hypothetical protein